jgi:hypothetical protein
MNRYYLALGLTLFAIFAFGAIAQNASARPLTAVVVCCTPQFVHITDQQEGTHEIKTPNGTVSCTTVTSDATTETTGSINELTVASTYTGCTAFGFASAHVSTNGCTYTYTTATSVKAGEVTWSGSTQTLIVCPVGKSIEITPTTFGVSACTQFIGAQTPTAGHALGKNVSGSSPMHVTIETRYRNVHYTGTGGLCGNSETHSDAEYIGNITRKCYSNFAHTTQIDCTFS